MIKYLNAILWREFKSAKDNIVSKLIVQAGMTLILTIIFISKVKVLNTVIDINIIKSFLIYILAMSGYISFISNLKFWQEKRLRTIESLLATPIPMKLIMFSKILAPTIVSTLMIFIHYLIYSTILLVFFQLNTFNLDTLLIPTLLSIIFNICYGFINGYGMWCADIIIAKILQYISIAIYFSYILSIFTISSNGSILNYGAKYALIPLGVLSFYCILFTSKEKAITTLQE